MNLKKLKQRRNGRHDVTMTIDCSDEGSLRERSQSIPVYSGVRWVEIELLPSRLIMQSSLRPLRRRVR